MVLCPVCGTDLGQFKRGSKHIARHEETTSNGAPFSRCVPCQRDIPHQFAAAHRQAFHAPDPLPSSKRPKPHGQAAAAQMASSDDDGEVIHPAAGAARGWVRRRSTPSQTEAAWQSVSIVQSQIREGQGAAQGAPAVCQAAADAALLADIALRHSLPGPCVRDIVEYIQRPGFSAAPSG